MRFLTIFTLITTVIFIQCINTSKSEINIEDIEGSSWSIEIAPGCVNTLAFLKDQKYIDYSCERNDSLFGTYEIKESNIILFQEGSIYDKYEKEGSSTRIGKAKFTLKLEGSKMKYLKREDFFNDEWTESKYTFPDDFCYELVK